MKNVAMYEETGLSGYGMRMVRDVFGQRLIEVLRCVIVKKDGMSKYSLFTSPKRKGAEAEIDELIRATVEQYEGIKHRYSHVGIGDTATDERVVSRLYGVMHFGDWGWPEKLDKREAEGRVHAGLEG